LSNRLRFLHVYHMEDSCPSKIFRFNLIVVWIWILVGKIPPLDYAFRITLDVFSNLLITLATIWNLADFQIVLSNHTYDNIFPLNAIYLNVVNLLKDSTFQPFRFYSNNKFVLFSMCFVNLNEWVFVLVLKKQIG
jgi:hypothetical protein